ncbi:MAG: ATP-binding protein [Phycisphaerales bacterium]|nr:MAG: ATP-binding protein [Phycisphaerales bacterium]
MLVQVITNLLTNATRYTPEHGSITLEAVQSGDEIKISVRDTGKGISPELLPNIFGEFVQGDSCHPKGLGIGLNLVHKLVTAHGGSVAARSEGAGKGSEFTVRLPIGWE